MKIVKRDLALSCLSVHVELLGSHWMVFHEILYLSIFKKKLSRKFKFGKNLTRVTGSLHEHIRTFMVISC